MDKRKKNSVELQRLDRNYSAVSAVFPVAQVYSLYDG